MSRLKPLSRNQLAEFLPNSEAIKAFENLMNSAFEILPSDVAELFSQIAEVQNSASYANSIAGQSAGLISALEQMTALIAAMPRVVNEENRDVFIPPVYIGSLGQQESNNVLISGGAVNATLGATTANTANVTSINISLDVTLSGLGKRIIADFNNSTVANRCFFKTSTVNGSTNLAAIPNGTGVTATAGAVNNSDPTDSSFARVLINGTVARLESGIFGAGSYLPWEILTNGLVRVVVSVAGDAGFGVAAPTTEAKLQSSNGIHLGNSANSNTNVLDWYEEGSNTPIVLGLTTAGTATYQKQVHRYVRRGNRVEGQITLGWTGHTGTGTMSITALPYTSNSTTNNNSACTIFTNGITYTSGDTLQAVITPGTTNIRIYDRAPTGGATLHLVEANVTTLTINYSYEV